LFSQNGPPWRAVRVIGESPGLVETADVDQRSERIQARFEWPVICAALLTIPVLFIQESHLGQPWQSIGIVLNWATWLTFASEVVVMLWVVPRKRTWLRSHVLDLAITVLTPPFAPAAWQAGRAFRLFQLLRLVRVFSVRRLLSLEGIKYAALTAAGTVLLGGALVASLETEQHWTTWDGVWWAATTVTTVGYGDLAVKTDGGRIIAMAIMLVGIGFVALLTAFIADRFVQGQREVGAKENLILTELQEIRMRLENLESTGPDLR
jgi:voltage-gated potassium channel